MMTISEMKVLFDDGLNSKVAEEQRQTRGMLAMLCDQIANLTTDRTAKVDLNKLHGMLMFSNLVNEYNMTESDLHRSVTDIIEKAGTEEQTLISVVLEASKKAVAMDIKRDT